MRRSQFYPGLCLCLLAALAVSDIGADWSEDGWAELEHRAAEPLLYWRGPLATRVMWMLTQLGSFPFLLVVVCLGTLAPANWLKARDKAAFVTLAVGQGFLNNFLKAWFGRPRPGEDYHPLVEERYFSFPSGHTMGSLCIYGFLAYLWVRRRPRSAPLVFTLTTTLVLLIGLSRIYLSAHYPGDVVGGLAAGWPCLFGAMLAHAGISKTKNVTKVDGRQGE